MTGHSPVVAWRKETALGRDAPPDAPPDAAVPPGRLAAQRRYSSVAATCDDISVARRAKVRLWQLAHELVLHRSTVPLRRRPPLPPPASAERREAALPRAMSQGKYLKHLIFSGLPPSQHHALMSRWVSDCAGLGACRPFRAERQG